jgi:hypothetical protein
VSTDVTRLRHLNEKNGKLKKFVEERSLEIGVEKGDPPKSVPRPKRYDYWVCRYRQCAFASRRRNGAES